MHVRVLFPIVERRGYDSFAIAIDEEINRSRGDDPDQVGPKSSEQSSRTFDTVYLTETSVSCHASFIESSDLNNLHVSEN